MKLFGVPVTFSIEFAPISLMLITFLIAGYQGVLQVDTPSANCSTVVFQWPWLSPRRSMWLYCTEKSAQGEKAS
jgi:hypothetical protein